MRFERPPRWRRLLKDAVASAISRTRSLTSLAPAARSCRPLVIGYHRVVEDFDRAAATDMPTMLVSRTMFERHVEWIGRHFEFVSLDEIGAHIESGEPFSRPVATLTFDDGYRDVYEHAVPTLMRVGAAATVFVVTEPVQESAFDAAHEVFCRSVCVGELPVPKSDAVGQIRVTEEHRNRGGIVGRAIRLAKDCGLGRAIAPLSRSCENTRIGREPADPRASHHLNGV